MYETSKYDLYKFLKDYPSTPKNLIVAHFKELGHKKTSIYRWLRLIEQEKSLDRKKGSGRRVKIATKQNILKIRNHFNQKSARSQRKMANKLDCHRTYIGKILKKYSDIKRRRKPKKMLINDTQLESIERKSKAGHEKYEFRSRNAI